MPTYRRPGTYVEEALLPTQIATTGTASAMGAFLGTSSRGPTTATFFSSWTTFTKAFGSFDAAYTLHFAVYNFFANGGRGCWVSRVLGTSSSKAAVTLTDRAATPLATITVTAINEGTWANGSVATTGINVEVVDNGATNPARFDLLVYQGGATSTTVVERFNDLSMSINDSRYFARQINGLSQYITVVDLLSATTSPADGTRPSASGAKPLATGSDGTAPTPTAFVTALTFGNAAAAFDICPQTLLLNVPDTTAMSSVNATTVIQAAGVYADARGDVFVVADVPSAVSGTSAVVSYAAGLMTGTSMLGNAMALYYPWITVSDPIGPPGAVRSLAPGGAIVGLYQQVEDLVGSFRTPAGLGYPLANTLGPSVRLTATDLDSFNAAAVPVNALRVVPGSGTVIMGGRTMRQGYSDRYIAVRRSLHYIKKALQDATAFALFENNDERLWGQLLSVCNGFLTQYWQEGGLRGSSDAAAFYVKCDATLNTPQVIANGEVRMEVGVALQTPAEFVIIRIGQINGTSTVTSN